MSKEDAIEAAAVVLEPLPTAMFKVELENKHVVLAPSQARCERISSNPAGRQGRRGVSPYDLTRGRIVYRYK
jgi:translation initiation factor IF-1